MNDNTTTDEILLQNLEASDEMAFREIYTRYWERLFFTALKRVKAKEDAEEIVQNVFVSLWERRFSATIIENLEAYLNTAIKYKVISHIEKLMRSSRTLNELHVSAEDNSTQESLALQDLNEAIQRVLNTLPLKTKQIFTLSRYQRWSVKEIALGMSMSEKAVEYHITQSLKLLKVKLRNFTLLLLLAFFF